MGRGGVNAPLTLTAAEVADLLGSAYTAEKVRRLYRAGNFPAPIDPTLHARSWSWSRRVVEGYAEGEVAA
jgi:hypothetical protein